jgi:hypothetical protein
VRVEGLYRDETLYQSGDDGSLKHGHMRQVHDLLNALSKTAQTTERASSHAVRSARPRGHSRGAMVAAQGGRKDEDDPAVMFVHHLTARGPV